MHVIVKHVLDCIVNVCELFNLRFTNFKVMQIGQKLIKWMKHSAFI